MIKVLPWGLLAATAVGTAAGCCYTAVPETSASTGSTSATSGSGGATGGSGTSGGSSGGDGGPICPASCPIDASCDPATTIDGKCICDNPAYTACGATCVNLNTDTAHCGSCDIACDGPAGYACLNSNCICGRGMFGLCRTDGGPDICSDPTKDRQNCGFCGNDCGPYQCVDGACCSPPRVLCSPDGGGISCADVANDINNCGACGAICGPPAQSPAVRAKAWRCASTAGGPGVCGCNDGYNSCQVGPGLPVTCDDLSSDISNCGTCNHTCLQGPCVDGGCS